MVDTSNIPSVTFHCLDDEFWTVIESGADVAAFLNCTQEQFEHQFNNSFLKTFSTGEKPVIGEMQVSLIDGKITNCFITKEDRSLCVCLDSLPVEGLVTATNMLDVGLFCFSGKHRLTKANEVFYRLIGSSKEAFSQSHGNDLFSLTGPLKTNALQSVTVQHLDGKQRSLFFSIGETAGFCVEFDANSYDQLQLYKQSLLHNGFLVWEYDVGQKRVFNQTFSAKDLEALQPLHQRLEDGELTSKSTLFLDSLDSGSHCYFVQYTRKDAKALAVAQNLSVLPERHRFSFFEDQLSLSKTQDLLSFIKADLTNDRLTKIQKHGLNLKQYSLPTRYSEWISLSLSSIVSEEDKQIFKERFSLESLLKLASEGIRNVSLEFRTQDEFGVIRWLETRVMLTYESESENVYAIEVSRYITDKKKIELALTEKALREKDSGFYDRNTSAMMIEGILRNGSGADSSYAIALIDIKGLKPVSSQVKHSLIPHMAQLLRMGLYEKCIIGRFDESRFIVFFEQVDSVSQIRKILDRLSQMIANAYLFVPVSLTFWSNIGFYVGTYSNNVSYTELFEKASLAMDKANEKGRNQVVSFDWENGVFPGGKYIPANTLDENAQGVLLGCMDATLSSDNLDSTMPLVLSQLGMYYKASRVCLLTQEQAGILEILASWEPANASHSFGLFETDPFEFIPKMHEVVHLKGSESGFKVPCFAGYDLLVGRLKVWGLEKGYIVVVGPNTSELSVLSHSVQLISSEMTKRRLLDRQEYLVYHDPTTGLLNYNGYNQYVSTLREDALSSLALALVDINNLRDLNKNYGKEYGNEIISLVSEKIQEYFPSSALFRISGDEFVIICQDFTYESFNKKISRLYNELEKEKPNAVTLGQAWSENDLHVSVLFNQANIVLDARRQNSLEHSSKQADFHLAINALVEAINRGEYVVFLQPKVNSITSKVCGAEALIRRLDPKLGLVSPAHFIAQLEKDGLVKFIDLFVFRQVCQTLRRWLDEGTPLLPISLNFSRVTLLDEDLIPSMLRIKEEYQVDSKYIEIEITESFGALERNLVKKVVQAISDAGFCICIDDFGSEYSNLSTLTSLPLGILKLDKSLIDNLCTSTNSQVFVDGFVSICRKLGILTVAEGVETENQKNMVIEMGCDMIQGYFYDKPISIGSFEQKYMAEK
jgi:diguanylate cyclase (GGDEF)-like protein